MATVDLLDQIHEASKLMCNQRQSLEEPMQRHNQHQTPTIENTHLFTPPTSAQSERSKSLGYPCRTGSNSHVQEAVPPGAGTHGFDENPSTTDANGIHTIGHATHTSPDSYRVYHTQSAYNRINSGSPNRDRQSETFGGVHYPIEGGMTIVDSNLQRSATAYNLREGEIPGHRQFVSGPSDRGPAPTYSSFENSSVSVIRNERTPFDGHHAASYGGLHGVRPSGTRDNLVAYDGNSNATITPQARNAGGSSHYQRRFNMNTAMAYLRPGVNRVSGIDSWPAWLESPAAQDQIVQELFDAVYNLEMAQDGPNGAWTESVPYKAVADGKIDPTKVEAYCWRLFANVRDIHVSGSCFTQEKPPTVTMAVKAELSDSLGIRVDSNEDSKTNVLQRFQNIKYALKRWKIFINDLEHEGKSKMLALAPLGMLSKKGVYRANNMQKQQRLKEQREMKKAAEDAARGASDGKLEAYEGPNDDQSYLSSAQRGRKRSREDGNENLSEAPTKRTRTSPDIPETGTTELAGPNANQPHHTSTSLERIANEDASRRHLDFSSSRRLSTSPASGSWNGEGTSPFPGYNDNLLTHDGHGAFPHAQTADNPTLDVEINPAAQTQNYRYAQRDSQSFGSNEDLERLVNFNKGIPDVLGDSSVPHSIPHQPQPIPSQESYSIPHQPQPMPSEESYSIPHQPQQIPSHESNSIPYQQQPIPSQDDSEHPNYSSSQPGPVMYGMDGDNATYSNGFVSDDDLRFWGFAFDN